MRPLHALVVVALLVVIGGCVAPPVAPSGTSVPPTTTRVPLPPPTEPPATVTVTHTCTVRPFDDYDTPLAVVEGSCRDVPEASLPCVWVQFSSTWTDSAGKIVQRQSGISPNPCPDDEPSADPPPK